MTTLDEQNTLNYLANKIHRDNVAVGWWTDGKDKYVLATKLMLTVSEISEAMEGLRKDKMDDHLQHRKAVEVELADALIRIFDFAGALGLDISGAFNEKLQYNANRQDHKKGNREAEGGKKF